MEVGHTHTHTQTYTFHKEIESSSNMYLKKEIRAHSFGNENKFENREELNIE